MQCDPKNQEQMKVSGEDKGEAAQIGDGKDQSRIHFLLIAWAIAHKRSGGPGGNSSDISSYLLQQSAISSQPSR